jgi:hypothetical protein
METVVNGIAGLALGVLGIWLAFFVFFVFALSMAFSALLYLAANFIRRKIHVQFLVRQRRRNG